MDRQPLPLQPAGLYADAQSYLEAVVEGREAPDQLRIAAAKTLIAYQRARQRAPVASPAPWQLAARAGVARDAAQRDEWERTSSVIRARFGTKKT